MKKLFLKYSVAALSIFILLNNFIFAPNNILSWDVFGYYLYLPLQFIYNDLGLHHVATIHDIIEKYNSTATFYQALDMPNGNHVMKYSMGLSFFYAPFFFIGHLIAVGFNYPTDGFSLPYQYSIFIGGIIYSIFGIWFLSKVLMRFFTDGIVLLVLVIIVFSTNYLVHITMYGQNAMSHNYLFTAYALILWFTIRWHETYRLKYITLLGIICGITILSRPSEIVCLVIPALWNAKDFPSIKEKITLLLKYKIQFIAFAIILFGFGACQFIYWKIYAGKFLFNSYGANAGEGFEFTRPHILEVLFSFRKGWLIYTPIMLLAIKGFYFIYKNNRAIFYALFVYFTINLYIVSSWSTWWYASSFSQRPLIPTYPIMAIGLGYFLTWINRQSIIKGITYTLIAAFLLLNLFQTRQFHYGIIDGERMTAAYYFKTFGKMNATEEDKKSLLVNRSFAADETFTNPEEYSSTLVKKADSKYTLDSISKTSPCFESPYSNLTKKDHAWIKVTANVYPVTDIAKDSFRLTVRFNHNGYPYKDFIYGSSKMNLELNQWNKVTFYYLTPPVRRESDPINICFLHNGNAVIYIDEFQVEAYEKK